MTAPDTAMILAAGFGTRMGTLTRERPKPLLEAGGRSLIDHALDTVEAAGIGRAVVNLHYLGDRIRRHLGGRTSPQIRFSEETPEILDTGGGIRQALPLLGPRAFCTLNSDAIFAGRNPLSLLMEHWDAAAMDALMLLVPLGQARAHVGTGDFVLDAETGLPRRHGRMGGEPLVFTGAQVLLPRALDGTPDGAFSLNVVWDRLLADGRLSAVVYPDVWIDAGTPEGLAAAGRTLAGEGA